MNKPDPAVPVLTSFDLCCENIAARGMKMEDFGCFLLNRKEIKAVSAASLQLTRVGCSSATTPVVRRKDTRFDFAVQDLGHHQGLGSPEGLTRCPQDFMHLRLESLNKYRKRSEHRDQVLGSSCHLPTHCPEPYQDAESGSLLCSLNKLI